MSDITVEQVKDFLGNMKIKDLAALVSDLEEEWDVKAATGGGMMMMAPGAGADAAEEEQTEFDVVLESIGPKKIQVIKVVREITGLGLKEAKALVESAPCPVKQGLEKGEADALKEKIEESGASVVVK